MASFELDKIYEADAHEFAKNIPDGSVNLAICDPVWWKVDDYAWLAETCKRILKPHGLCIVQVGQYYKYDVMMAMGQHLNWYWEIAERLQRGAAFFARKMVQFHKSHLIFSNGIEKMTPDRRFVPDMIHSPRNKAHHKWQDSIATYAMLVEMFTKRGDIVFDPFTCTGTIPIAAKRAGRHFLACDIDGEIVKVAQERLALVIPERIHEPEYVMEQVL